MYSLNLSIVLNRLKEEEDNMEEISMVLEIRALANVKISCAWDMKQETTHSIYDLHMNLITRGISK